MKSNSKTIKKLIQILMTEIDSYKIIESRASNTIHQNTTHTNLPDVNCPAMQLVTWYPLDEPSHRDPQALASAGPYLQIFVCGLVDGIPGP